MDDASEIKSRINIVDVVNDYVRLTPAGASFKALCPFHKEKTPSFTVNEERQIFHCFGCGKGGDVFTFIQEIEGVDFVGALKILADKLGIELKGYSKENAENSLKAKEALQAAVDFYAINLYAKEGKQALDYLQKRGFSDSVMKKFSLGFALDGWQGLADYLIDLGFKAEEIEKAGLIKKSSERQNSYYDRFRNRIMFPIFNPTGSPVGFSGRILPGDDSKMGKYINSPQTNIYDKGRSIYGINLAKVAIKQEDKCVLLEGNLDVIASHLAEVENVVAACGTAVTAEQLQIIQRYSNNVVFAFDLDEAGVNASKKGIDLALSLGLNVGALDLSEAEGENKDAADIVQNSPDTWKKITKKVKPAMEYYFDIILAGCDLEKAEQKKTAVEEILSKINLFPSKIDQDHYLKKLSGVTGVKLEILYDIFSEKWEAERMENIGYKSAQKVSTEEKPKELKDLSASRKIEKLLNRIAALLMLHSTIHEEKDIELLKKTLSGTSGCDAKEMILEIIKKEARFSNPNHYLALFKDERIKTRASLLITIAENQFNSYNDKQFRGKYSPQEDFRFCLAKVEEITKKEKMEILLKKIKSAEESNDTNKVQKYAQEYNKILKNNLN